MFKSEASRLGMLIERKQLRMQASPSHMFLARSGADIHRVANNGASPLHLAVFKDRKEVVDYLIKKGADFDDQGNAVAKACKYCGATDVPTMMMCSGCRIVWYCGPVCQKKDWREGGENRHKVQCPRIKEQRELYKEKRKSEVKGEVKEINERLMRQAMLKGDGASSSRL